MGCSPDRRVVALLVLLGLVPGCVTGHLFAAGCRREYARAIHGVTLRDDTTIVRYTADVTDDNGAPVGTVERTRELPGRRDQIVPRELTRTRTAGWVYPLVPPSLALDVVVVPIVTLLAPIVLVVGE